MSRKAKHTLWSNPGDTDEDLPPELIPYALKQYQKAWDCYIEAGCPFGDHDKGMLLWFTFDQQTRES